MIWDIIVFLLQAALVFVVSTALFDALHWTLHKWEGSRIPLLRTPVLMALGAPQVSRPRYADQPGLCPGQYLVPHPARIPDLNGRAR